ncbi:hypothetical protein Tco_0971703 [Tanacetum coccineum]
MDANKKLDLENVQCPSRARFYDYLYESTVTYSIGRISHLTCDLICHDFWHTLREDGSKYQLKFKLDRKELTFTLDDFRTIFNLPQANDNNHASFVPPPSFSDKPWQTLCKIFSKCLTTRITGWDQPPLQIMQMMKQNKVGMRIHHRLITEEKNYTEHYKMQSARLIPPVPVPTAEKADEMILQDTIQVSLAEHKSREEQEARENVALVDEHLAAEEIEKLVENHENVDDSSPPRHDDTSILGTRFMPQKSSDQLANNLYDVMMEMLPSLVKEKVTEQVKKEVPTQVRDQVPVYVAKGLIMERKTTKEETETINHLEAYLARTWAYQAPYTSQIQNAIDNRHSFFS